MIERNRHLRHVLRTLGEEAGVVLLGPRQVGKTTLAREVASAWPDSSYLDLEEPEDRQVLEENPGFYLSERSGRLVVIDEVQRLPGLFESLRGQIDERRRAGHRTGQFLLLGSAYRDMLRQTGESLAGRVHYHELTPFGLGEVRDAAGLWLRGGFPESFLAGSDRLSLRRRRNLVTEYLERDIPSFGVRIPAETLRRLWTMLAHRQGSILNAAELARNMGVSSRSVLRYIDLLVDLLLVRRLEPWHSNAGKRLVKSPRVYIRDSGLVHALLGIETLEDLLGNYAVGASWEGFCIEQLVGAAPEWAEASFYRSSGGAEIDLILALPGGKLWGFEIKRSTRPKVERGFHVAAEELGLAERILVHGGERNVPAPGGVRAMPLADAVGLLGALSEN